VFLVLIDKDLYQLIFKIMTAKRKSRKLEFKKETIARLGDEQLSGLYGGADGGNQSVQVANQCTVVGKTKGARHTCNAVLCRTTTI